MPDDDIKALREALLPCPMCGGETGYTLSSGSTFRWYAVACADCGRDIGECRVAPGTPYSDPIPARWAGADDEWNDAAAHAHALRGRITRLLDEVERLRAEVERQTAVIRHVNARCDHLGMSLRDIKHERDALLAAGCVDAPRRVKA